MNFDNIGGKVAVITGASSGIGSAAARLLVAEGVNVVLAARRTEKIQALAKELGKSAVAVTVDVGDGEQVARLFDEVHERFGGLDLLFNNAGIGLYGSFLESTPTAWKAQIDANVYGVLYCTHAALPLMRGRKGAMVSTVSSVAGHYGFADWSVYSATKFAVIGFHDAMRKEFGAEGIRFSLIDPGSVWSEWGHNTPDGMMQKRRETVDALLPEDVATALIYSFAQPDRVLVEEIVIRPVRQLAP
jgi:NADP-dependent 3-hydroxy acid dehydrogenase YdfG